MKCTINNMCCENPLVFSHCESLISDCQDLNQTLLNVYFSSLQTVERLEEEKKGQSEELRLVRKEYQDFTNQCIMQMEKDANQNNHLDQKISEPVYYAKPSDNDNDDDVITAIGSAILIPQ
eukprot:UN28738